MPMLMHYALVTVHFVNVCDITFKDVVDLTGKKFKSIQEEVPLHTFKEDIFLGHLGTTNMSLFEQVLACLT